MTVAAGTVTAEAVREALRDVHDPELPVSIVDLGLVREVDVAPDGTVRVGLTFTSLACPCTDLIREDVERRVAALDGVRAVEVRDVFASWSLADVSEEARLTLRTLAII